jgi:hypothetical protein
MGWAQVRAPGLGLELCLNIDTFFKKNTLEERILIPEHQTLISSRAMSSLKVIQIWLMHPNSFLELLDVLCAALTEGRLSLAVALLALLRCCVDRLATALALGLLSI